MHSPSTVYGYVTVVTNKMDSENGRNSNKLSHKKWKSLLKREKRRLKRQQLAQERDAAKRTDLFEVSEDDESRQQNQAKYEEAERQRLELHALWLAREAQAQQEWQAKQEAKERERIRIKEQERLIKEEWEAQKKKEQEEEEEQKKKEAEKKQKQEELLKEATKHEKKEAEEWHNPLAPDQYNSESTRPHADMCTFFLKTGACRFGDRCSRGHPILESSSTILFPNMYQHFALDQGLVEEFDLDVTLEFDERELYQHFREFYNDVLPELKSMGRVIQFKVCCNYEPHLRGNVYVQFSSEEAAMLARNAFNGRYYAGRQISAELCCVKKWKPAICGTFFSKRCPKGKNCNFLHVFKNPNNEFSEADRDELLREDKSARYSSRSDYRERHHYRDDYQRRRHSRASRRSLGRSRSRRSRSRSRSPCKGSFSNPSKNYARSPSPRLSPRRHSRSPRRHSRSPRRYSRSPRRHSRSPRRYSRSPRRHSRSPRRYSRSPERSHKSPKRHSRKHINLSSRRSRSPLQCRASSNSKTPSPRQESPCHTKAADRLVGSLDDPVQNEKDSEESPTDSHRKENALESLSIHVNLSTQYSNGHDSEPKDSLHHLEGSMSSQGSGSRGKKRKDKKNKHKKSKKHKNDKSSL